MKAADLTGKRFGIVTVLERDLTKDKSRQYWICRCDCGVVKTMRADVLKKPVESCGCLRNEKVRIRAKKKHPNRTHGETNTHLYKTWSRMKDRCFNKNHKHYEYYGGSGIKVCEEWENSYESFRDWARANGYEEGLTIERIDITKDYKPSNCEWIPLKEQSNNRRSTVWIEYNGKRQNLKQWSEELGIKYGTLQQRHYRYGEVPPRLFRKVE